MPAPKASRKKKSKRGRPPALDETVKELFCQALAAGNYLHTAADYVGLHRSTLSLWMKRGRKEKKGVYREFFDAVTKAMATAEAGHVANIMQAARGRRGEPAQKAVLEEGTGRELRPARPAVPELRPDWTASAWWLERTRPEKFARRVFRPEEESRPTSAAGAPALVIYLPAEDPPSGPAALGHGAHGLDGDDARILESEADED